MSDLVWALNLVSGQVGRINRHILEHPLFGETNIEVAPGTKSYVPELWHATNKTDYLNSNPGAVTPTPVVTDSADIEGTNGE